MPNSSVFILLGACLSYLLGSIPFSQIIAQGRMSVDLRQAGYHNVGAYNVLRTVGYHWALLAAILDAAKGISAIAIVTSLGLMHPFDTLTVLCAILGHNYPVWLGFRGGKGVMVAAGMLYWMMPLETVLAVAAAYFVFRKVRLVNVSVTCGFVLLIGLSLISHKFEDIQLLVFGAILLIGLAYLPRLIRWLSGHWNRISLSRRRSRL